jgi:hypothetical protein
MAGSGPPGKTGRRCTGMKKITVRKAEAIKLTAVLLSC